MRAWYILVGVLICTLTTLLPACSKDKKPLLVETIMENPSVYKYSFTPSAKDNYLLIVYYFEKIDKEGKVTKLAKWKVVPKTSQQKFLQLPESVITIENGDGYFEELGDNYYQNRTFKFMGWEHAGVFDKFENSYGSGGEQDKELSVLFTCFNSSEETKKKIMNITHDSDLSEKSFLRCKMVNSKTGCRLYALVGGLLLDEKTFKDLNLVMRGERASP